MAEEEKFTRRTVLKGTGATLGMAAFAAAVAPLAQLTEDMSIDELLQKHYKELSPRQMQRVPVLKPKNSMALMSASRITPPTKGCILVMH